MRGKIISVLLILIILTMSIPVFHYPVTAKALVDYEDYWTSYRDENWVGGPYPDNIIEYNTVDDYLNAHYANYENIDKEQITRLFIDSKYGIYLIKDLSGLYEFENLEELSIDFPKDEAIKELDLTKLTNLKKLSISGTKISYLKIEKLTNLTYLDIECYDEDIDGFTVDFKQMTKLDHFEFLFYPSPYDDREDSEKIRDISSRMLMPDNYELYFSSTYGYDNDIHCVMMEKLNVNVSTDKTAYKLGDKVTTTVNWDKGMQATDFEINFDSSKLKFESASIDEDYYNLIEDGRILVSWASADEIDTQQIIFEFSAIGDGQAEILVLPENFADGNLDTDFVFKEGMQVITIEKSGYVKPYKEITTTVINNKETITGLSITDNKVTIGDFLKQDNFTSNVEVKVFDVNDKQVTDSSKGLGTGSKVKLFENGQVVKEFTVVVYGDTTGDGKIGAVDALTLIKGINQIIPFKSESHKEAARIMTGSGKEPKAYDALAIIKSANYQYTIDQSK